MRTCRHPAPSRKGSRIWCREQALGWAPEARGSGSPQWRNPPQIFCFSGDPTQVLWDSWGAGVFWAPTHVFFLSLTFAQLESPPRVLGSVLQRIWQPISLTWLKWSFGLSQYPSFFRIVHQLWTADCCSPSPQVTLRSLPPDSPSPALHPATICTGIFEMCHIPLHNNHCCFSRAYYVAGVELRGSHKWIHLRLHSTGWGWLLLHTRRNWGSETSHYHPESRNC